MRTMLAATLAVAVVSTAAMAQQPTAQTAPSNSPANKSAQAQSQPKGQPGAQTAARAPAEARAFATKVAAANAFEIQSSEIALEKSQSNDVKMFAQQMVADHTKAGQDFQAAVQQAGVTPPAADQTDAKHRVTLERLRRASGKAFDQAYINAQSQAHRDAVALYSRYAKSGRAEALKTFAQQTLPTLQQHDKMIQNLRKTGHMAMADEKAH